MRLILEFARRPSGEGRRFRRRTSSLSIVFGAALLLSACASPSPEFAGTTPTVVELDGATYSIFRRGSEVEVIRTGFVSPQALSSIQPTMLRLVRETTGCEVVEGSLTGDPALSRMKVDCN